MKGGGIILWTGWICAVGVALLGIVTGQRAIWVMTNGGTVKVVVFVSRELPELDNSVVVRGGQLMVDGVDSGYGGRIKVHGGLQATVGAGFCQICGPTYTGPVPLLGKRFVAFVRASGDSIS
jgi:hypothetical protein